MPADYRQVPLWSLWVSAAQTGSTSSGIAAIWATLSRAALLLWAIPQPHLDLALGVLAVEDLVLPARRLGGAADLDLQRPDALVVLGRQHQQAIRSKLF